MNEKSPEAFRTISEVAEWLGVPTHVLRFWESRFAQVKPVKRAGGRRYYRPADMELLGGIRKLLHDQGMTIRGVQKILREKGVRYVCGLSPSLDAPVDLETRSNVVDIDELRAEEEAAAFKEQDTFAEKPEPEPELSPEDMAFAADNAALSSGNWDDSGEEVTPDFEAGVDFDPEPGLEPELEDEADRAADEALAALEVNPPESFDDLAEPGPDMGLDADLLAQDVDSAEAPDEAVELPEVDLAEMSLEDMPAEVSDQVTDAIADETVAEPDAPTPDWDMAVEAEVPLPAAELPEEAIAALDEALDAPMETTLDEPLDELAMSEDVALDFGAPDLSESSDEAGLESGFETDLAALDEAGFEAAAPDDGLADLADLSFADAASDAADEALPDLEAQALPELGGMADELESAPAPMEGFAPLPDADELAPDLPELPEVEAGDLADLAALDGASEADISELPDVGGEDTLTEAAPELATLGEVGLPELEQPGAALEEVELAEAAPEVAGLADVELPEAELAEAGLPEMDLAELPPLASDAFAEMTPDEGGLALPGSDPLADMVELPVDLTTPLAEASAPLADLGEPVADLAAPMADAREPLADLGEPLGDLAEPLPDLAEAAEPSAELVEPLADLAEPLQDLSEPQADAAEPLPAQAEPLADLGGEAMEAAPVLDALILTPANAVHETPEPIAPELPEVGAEAAMMAAAMANMAPVDSPEMAAEAPATPAPTLVMPDIGPDPEDDDDLPLGALTAAHLRVLRAHNANVSTATFGALQDRLGELSLRWQDAAKPHRGQL